MTTTRKTDWEGSPLHQKDWASLKSHRLVTLLSKIAWKLQIRLWSQAYKMVQPRQDKFRVRRNFQSYFKTLRLSNSKEKRTKIRVRKLWVWTWNHIVRVYSQCQSQKEPSIESRYHWMGKSLLLNSIRVKRWNWPWGSWSYWFKSQRNKVKEKKICGMILIEIYVEFMGIFEN